MRTHLYLDRQSTNNHRTYRVYVDTGRIPPADLAYAGLVLQPDPLSRWYSGASDRHPQGHTTRQQAVSCLLRRVIQPRLEAAR